MAGRLNPKRTVTGIAVKRDGLLVAFSSDHGGPISFGTLLVPAEFLADAGIPLPGIRAGGGPREWEGLPLF